jgi:hypothetical protein
MTLSAMTSIRRRTAVLLAATAAILGSAAGAQQASALEFAVNDDGVLLYQRYYPRNTLLSQARSIGATWVRVNFSWSDYASNKFKYLDQLVSDAKKNGFAVHLTLTGTGYYFKGGSKTISYFKPSTKKYASWVKTIAKHYKGKVRRYSVWNEPNFPYFLSSKKKPSSSGTPALYCGIYKAGYAAIKSVDRKNKVLWGELAPLRDPLGFMKKAACRGTKTDGFAFHPYALNSRAVGIKSTPAIKKAAKKYLHTKNLYYTEFGYIRAGKPFGKTDAQRAALTVDGFKYAKKQGVKNLTYYILVQPPPAFTFDFDSGIIRADGNPGSVTPVYTRLQTYFRTGK